VLRLLDQKASDNNTKPLAINEPGDRFEREADVVADQVMRTPSTQAGGSQSSLSVGDNGNKLQRRCSHCEEEGKKRHRRIAPLSAEAGIQRKCSQCAKEEEEKRLHRKEDSGPNPQTAPSIVHDVLRAPGQPLDSGTRSFMEPRFGHDFSPVRIHTDAKAAESARAVNAQAYTVGNNVVFDSRQYAPESYSGRRLLAHELAHVVQQSSAEVSSRIQRQSSPDEKPLESDDALLACLLLAPPLLKPFCFEESKPQHKNKTQSPAPAPQIFPPSLPPPPMPKPAATAKKLNFYHGTRWSIAQKIPNNVKAIGGGDFAAGFYTHHDADDSKALARAVKWGRALANKPPAEPYAGVVRFGVLEPDYRQLFDGNQGKTFGLTSLDQKDFQQKQKEWLDFITAHGRMKDPVFKEKRKQWVHERREPQPSLKYNVIEGPFYTPIRGTKDKKPPPEDFKPFAEGRQLPQQVTFANDGIKLLNSAKVEKELKQYDAKTGKPQDPPAATPAAAGSLNDKQLNEATDEAQFDMGVITT
jgi:hypothetical protein